jgi:periplasmic protein TonB
MMKHYSILRHGAPMAVAVLLAACTSTSPPTDSAVVARPAPAPESSPQARRDGRDDTFAMKSGAINPRAYRKDAASHIYAQNEARIFKGRLLPMLYAIGVLNVEVDRQGQVQKLDWVRKPSHAPEVVSEIERTVRAAAPFPVPVRLGKVVYTDTWLWHKSGQFQLDTLTEGQD